MAEDDDMKKNKKNNFVIGREREKEELKAVFESNKPEFLGVYGRRRVGKTFLVREFFQNIKEGLFISFQGQKDVNTKTQIDTFYHELEKQFKVDYQLMRANNWQKTFHDLNKFIEKYASENKKEVIVLFMDELPWFCNFKSGFLPALDYYWNQHWSKNNKIKLIVCGSAASWMIKNIIKAKGGLHNRLTRRMYIAPFQFKEVREFSKTNKLNFTDMQLLQLYMVLGGVPFYWSLLKKSTPISKQVDDLFFVKNAILKDELQSIFRSLFDNSDLHLRVVKSLATVKSGIERNVLLNMCKIKSGGQASQYLDNLISSGFIEPFHLFGNKKKLTLFRLIDSFAYFDSYWSKQSLGLVAFWQNKIHTPKLNVWAGYAFENFCLQHINQIIQALEIGRHVEAIHSWQSVDREKGGTQIDLILERADKVLHIIEIKYSLDEFILKKDEAKNILNKVDKFKEKTQYKGQIKINLVTPVGLKKGIWNDEIFDSVITLKDLY